MLDIDQQGLDIIPKLITGSSDIAYEHSMRPPYPYARRTEKFDLVEQDPGTVQYAYGQDVRSFAKVLSIQRHLYGTCGSTGKVSGYSHGVSHRLGRARCRKRRQVRSFLCELDLMVLFIKAYLDKGKELRSMVGKMMMAGAILSLMFSTALSTPLPP